MNASVNALCFKEFLNNVRVGGGNVLSLQKVKTGIGFRSGNCDGESALCEIQPPDELILFLLFDKNVLSNDPHIGYTILDVLRDVVVAQEQNFHRKVSRLRFELIFSVANG